MMRQQQKGTKAVTTSQVFDAVVTWLADKAINTKAAYLRQARAWSLFLGADLHEPNATKLWREASYLDAKKYLLEASNQEAQPGRAHDNSPNGKVCGKTIRHKAVVLKSLYDTAIAAGVCEANPFVRVARESKGHKDEFRRPTLKVKPEHVEMFIGINGVTSVAIRDRAVMCVLFGAALRRGELQLLQLNDVMQSDKGTTFLRLRETKAQCVQDIALPEWVSEAVVACKKQREAEGAGPRDKLFVRYTERGARPIGDKFVYNLFKRYCHEFGITEDYTPHSARATAITRLLDLGVPHREVLDLSRHSSVTTLEAYDKRDRAVDNSAAKKLTYK
jgi:site-specific recombinase XerD